MNSITFNAIASTTFATALLLTSLQTFGDDQQKIDFRNDLVPVFTKAGCNAGACHGAALGRGGFKLSLYGGNPAADYQSIVQELQGRRINLATPEASLLLQKPTESISHGGGFRFDIDHESAQLIHRWIKQGASEKTLRNLDRVEITPQQVLSRIDQPIQLQAMAHFSDGTQNDVTRWTIFKAEDESSIQVDEEAGTATALRRGRHIVVARYLSEVVPVEIIVPLNDSKPDLASEPRWNFIDNEILTALESLHLPASPLADRATLERRVTLDLIGRLPGDPTVRAAESSPSDVPEDSRKNHVRLVDELLRSDEFTEYWTHQLAKLLRIRPQRDGNMRAATAYHRWLSQQVKQDVGYDSIARDLLLSLGDTHEVGPANFYRTVQGPREQAEFVSELFMGSRLRCANCHNHPLDRWTQDDYHGLAAIFATVESGQVITEKPRGEVIHPRTLEAAIAKTPGEVLAVGSLKADRSHDDDNRKEFADWLTQEDNPYFAKAIVNRLWKSMMGRGLVEPADDFRATNPATHPVLLQKLADDFKAHDYSIRHTLKLIATSATYSRSANALPKNKDDSRFYSHAIRRTLEPEVLADAIADVLGVHEEYGAEPVGTRAVALLNPKTPSNSLDILGRCGREASCESPDSQSAAGLPQKLHLFNGKLLNARLGHEDGRLKKMLASGSSSDDIIHGFYRVGLNRKPNNDEMKYWNQQLDELKSDKERQQYLEDFVWGLLTSNEFVTNH